MAAMKLLFVLLLEFAPLLLSVTTAFSPRDNYLINCGFDGTDTVTDSDNRVFTTDDFKFLKHLKKSVVIGPTHSSIVSSSLYRTARAFRSSGEFVFPIKDRGVHHLVRLHFYPTKDEDRNLSEAKFHVLANGFLLLANFSIPESIDLPVIKEYIVPPVSDVLEIAFLSSRTGLLSFVNAIEVISAPRDLIPDVAQFSDVGRNERMNGLLRNGFETVYRVNVGGFKLTPFNDTLWRTWLTDDEFLIIGAGSQSVHFSGPINYRIGGASREVSPDGVYNSARVIKSSDHSVPSENITWSFDVEKGYAYMVRLHFCDIASMALDMLYFNVYINGNLGYNNLDLSSITSRQLASPFYADFVVDMRSSDNLTVSVGPSNMSLPGSVDAILNGIEILKMNNSIRSFDGEGCVEFKDKISDRHGKLIFVFGVMGCAVLWLLVVPFTSQGRRSSYEGWTQLPVDAASNYKFGAPVKS